MASLARAFAAPSAGLLVATLSFALTGCGGGSSHGSAAAAMTASLATGCNCAPTVGPSAPTAGPARSQALPSVAVPATSARGNAPNGTPGLESAGYRDANGTKKLERGDVLVLRFDGPVRLSGFSPSRDLALAPGDTTGAGASAATDPARPQDVLVTLGDQPRLSVFGTYSLGSAAGPGKTPATVALAAGRKPDAVTGATGSPARTTPAVLVIAEPASRFEYQGVPVTDPPLAGARAFYGDLHAHTGYSDGKGDPQQAYDQARFQGGMDFFCLTDHNEALTSITWDRTLAIADAADVPGTFAALTGFEWSAGFIPPNEFFNHVNVIGTRKRVDLLRTVSLSGLYEDALERCYPQGAVGKFNHPSVKIGPCKVNMWDDFRYDARVDLFMKLIRVEGRGSSQTKELGYIPALEHGWHVSPTESGDNHAASWGTKGTRRTGIWAASVSRDSVLTALREGRTFATDDRDASIRLVADGALWMGSTVTRPGPITLTAQVQDPTQGEGFVKLELLGRNGAVLATIDPKGAAVARLDLTLDPNADTYVWAHAVETDGDELFSAPIYVDR